MSNLEKDFESTYYRYVDMIYRLCFSFLKNKCEKALGNNEQ